MLSAMLKRFYFRCIVFVVCHRCTLVVTLYYTCFEVKSYILIKLDGLPAKNPACESISKAPCPKRSLNILYKAHHYIVYV